MPTSLGACPACGSALRVERYHCETCDTRIDGRFENNALPGLNSIQLEFVKTFVRCEGKLTRMEAELGLSYPTIRNRLQDVIRAMGYEPRPEDSGETLADRRRVILDELDAGKISAKEAMRAIQAIRD